MGDEGLVVEIRRGSVKNASNILEDAIRAHKENQRVWKRIIEEVPNRKDRLLDINGRRLNEWGSPEY